MGTPRTRPSDPHERVFLDALDAHVSQFYEWLPWVDGKLDEVPKGPAERKAWLKQERSRAVNPAAEGSEPSGHPMGGRRIAGWPHRSVKPDPLDVAGSTPVPLTMSS